MSLARMFRTAVLGLVRRGIDGVVPTVLDEIHGRATGVVLSTMLCPFLLMARGDTQVERCAHHTQGYRLDHYGRRNDDARLGECADVDPTIKSRFANRNRDSNVSCHGGNTCQ